MGHPAHFHLFKHTIGELKLRGHHVHVAVTGKDILQNLLDETHTPYTTLAPHQTGSSLGKKAAKLVVSAARLGQLAEERKADLLVGCLSQIAWVGRMRGIPSLFFAEDDIHYTKLQGYITYPFVNHIVSPECVDVGRFAGKKIGYAGYHKLAYLHPKRFTPRRDLVEIPPGKRFCVLRFSNLSAYHDTNAAGLTNDLAERLVDLLAESSEVLVSSERQLPENLQKYRFRGKLRDIHHYLAFADLFIGDSQSMAVEAAVLGTPGIRFNNFVGRISVLKELEANYGLAFGVHPSEPERLLAVATQFLADGQLRQKLHHKRARLLREKIDVSGYFVDLLESYAVS